eukprot:gnl/Trimastix_PCT/3363.p1 GENE.gnl/Trimastix_PCT/3363~~gnl/Trimastix_PCT/3363.p1  ORF type:complete len:531 (-),score=96.20 gnl/Trimastix_PCT/3363:24-1559(-)
MHDEHPEGIRVGLDPSVYYHVHQELISKHPHVTLVDVPSPLDDIWADRPALPCAPLREHPLSIAGLSRADKLVKVREIMTSKKHKCLLLAGLDDIAWLFNIRGGDIPYVPLARAYALITDERAHLFCSSPCDEALQAALVQDGVHLSPYESFHEIGTLGLESLWADPQTTNLRVDAMITALNIPILWETSPVQWLKSIKTEEEIQAMKQCHLRDSLALARFFHWVETQVPQLLSQGAEITEQGLVEQLLAFRARDPTFLDPSFETIVACDANAAVVHYHPEPELGANAQLHRQAMILCDSGGQYEQGTTDVTRTVHLDQPTPLQRDIFTHVLRGWIAVQRAVFPSYQTASMLDSLCRAPMWEVGLDFMHGTGHGVGCYSVVHESPPRFSFRALPSDKALKCNQVMTVEPGCYLEKQFGVRIENLVCVEEWEKTALGELCGDATQMHHFVPLTWVPIQPRLVNQALLSPREKAWLCRYQAQCVTRLMPLLDMTKEEDQQLAAWLHMQAKALE